MLAVTLTLVAYVLGGVLVSGCKQHNLKEETLKSEQKLTSYLLKTHLKRDCSEVGLIRHRLEVLKAH